MIQTILLMLEYINSLVQKGDFVRNSLPIDFNFYTLTGGTPKNILGTTAAGVALPDNCYAIQIESGETPVKFKFVGATVSPTAFFNATDASYLPAASIVRIECGVSSARVGSPFLFFDRAISDADEIQLTLFMEAHS